MIPLIKPDLSFDEVKEDIAAIIESGILTNGEYKSRFESEIAKLTGTKHAIAVTSATSALHLSLAAANVGAGDEVLVADFTFPATANVVEEVGAKPVFVDIDPITYTIDLEDLEKKITKATKAMIPVDTFGAPADLPKLEEIAARHNLILIEDAACALGAKIDGRSTGQFGTAGCFSFHPRKSITTGEGGMITTNDDAVAERARLLRNHGGQAKGRYQEFVAAGFNYRMSETQAALGLAQLKRLGSILEVRRAKAKQYDLMLAGLPVRVPQTLTNAVHTYQSYVIELNEGVDRDAVIEEMRSAEIETTIGTYAVHAEPFYVKKYGYRPGDLANSYRAYKQTLTLPLYSSMTDADQEKVIEKLREVVS